MEQDPIGQFLSHVEGFGPMLSQVQHDLDQEWFEGIDPTGLVRVRCRAGFADLSVHIDEDESCDNAVIAARVEAALTAARDRMHEFTTRLERLTYERAVAPLQRMAHEWQQDAAAASAAARS